jgi:hypothetical protein
MRKQIFCAPTHERLQPQISLFIKLFTHLIKIVMITISNIFKNKYHNGDNNV